MASKICLIILVILAVILFFVGIFLLLPFPLAVYPSLVRSQLHLSRAEDGSFPTLTHYWSKLPSIAYYDYYFFNITNPDEVMYENAMPSFVEVGPYSYKEWEFKEGIEWSENDNKIYYQNNKSFAYNASRSCTYCTYKDILTLPNAAYMAVMALIAQNQNSPNVKLAARIMDLTTILLGESPMRTVPMAGVLFDSYPDPFVSLTNSKLMKIIAPNNTLFGLTLPPIKYMGYFPKYNHTNDENYLIYSGKSDAYKTGSIIEWAGNTSMNWWGDSYSRDFDSCGDGSFNKINLKQTDKVNMFQSYACRVFHMTYSDKKSVRGIKTFVYKLENYDYDTTIELNRGYRYENLENADYFPNWPCGLNHTFNPSANCASVDCSLSVNWCNQCCNGSHYQDTVFMPPGIIPLRCLPGQKVRLPFAGFLSPPHFLQSPSEVVNSMRGLKPVPDRHEPAVFNINPTTGSTVRAKFRMQLAIPIYNSHLFTLTRNIKNAMSPSFWVDINVDLKDYAVSYLKLVTVIIPDIALGLGIAFIVLTLGGMLTTTMVLLRKMRSKRSNEVVLSTLPANTEDQDKSWS